jgi:hypothetical protein
MLRAPRQALYTAAVFLLEFENLVLLACEMLRAYRNANKEI